MKKKINFTIEPKADLWPKRVYKPVERGEHFVILRPYTIDLDKSIEELLRRKQKWE